MLSKELQAALVSQYEATKQAWSRHKRSRDLPPGLYGHDTGIHRLNLAIGGWLPDKLTTIGGRSGMGKTALVVPMFLAGARVLNDRRCEFLFFSWEMGPNYIVDRIVCSLTGLPLHYLGQGARYLDTSYKQIIERAYREAAKLPVTYQVMTTDIDAVKAYGYEFLELCAEKSKVEGVQVHPVIVIDYVGIARFENFKPRTYDIGDFMNGLKQFCNESGASAVVFAQIGRKADEKGAPERADFADSQSIEMASDNLIAIYRPEYFNEAVIYDPVTKEELPSTNKMLVRVLKSRDYGPQDFVINADLSVCRFYDLQHGPEFKYWELYQDEAFWREQLKPPRTSPLLF